VPLTIWKFAAVRVVESGEDWNEGMEMVEPVTVSGSRRTETGS
jgi:hypothetical protein